MVARRNWWFELTSSHEIYVIVQHTKKGSPAARLQKEKSNQDYRNVVDVTPYSHEKFDEGDGILVS